MSSNINEKTKELQYLLQEKTIDIKKVEELIQQGANVNAPLAEGPMASGDLGGMSILNLCVPKLHHRSKYKSGYIKSSTVSALLIDKGAKPDREAVERITSVLAYGSSADRAILLPSLIKNNLFTPEMKFVYLNALVKELISVRVGYAESLLKELRQNRSDLLQSNELFETFKNGLKDGLDEVIGAATQDDNSADRFNHYVDFIELFKPEQKKYREIVEIFQEKIENLKNKQPGYKDTLVLKNRYDALDGYIKDALSSSIPAAPPAPFPSVTSAASAAKPSSQSEHDKGDKKATVDTGKTSDKGAKPGRS